MGVTNRRRQVYLDLLQRCGIQCEELPPQANHILSQINYFDLIAPLIWDDKKAGLTIGKIAIKYEITHKDANNIIYLKRNSPYYNKVQPNQI